MGGDYQCPSGHCWGKKQEFISMPMTRTATTLQTINSIGTSGARAFLPVSGSDDHSVILVQWTSHYTSNQNSSREGIKFLGAS